MREEGLPDLLRRILADGLAALAAVELRYVRPQHLHVVADFRHRAHRGTGALDGVDLLDRNGGRDAFDAVHLRLVHPVEKLPCVRGKSFDVTPLALGEEGVERQGTLPRTAQTGDDDELVVRPFAVNILAITTTDTAPAAR